MAVMLLLEKARAIEQPGAAKRPGISNDDRNFNTGRESALEVRAHSDAGTRGGAAGKRGR